MPYTKRPRTATGYVTVWNFEPRPDDPLAELGNLYAVIEVISGGREAEEVVDLTLETIRQAYYEEGTALEPVERFEAATKAVNRALTEYVNRGNAGWVGKMSAILAVLQDDQLHAAYTGSAEAYLYRGGHAAQISLQNQSRIQQPSKIFASIASGQLEVGDKLLLATPALVHQLSLKQLQTIMHEQAPSTAVAKIVALLGDQPTDRVAALILEFTTPERAAEHTIPAAASRNYTLNQPGSILEQAKATAAPIVDTASKHSRQLGTHLQTAVAQGWPKWRRAGWKAAERVRHWLQQPGRLRITAIVAGIILVVGLGLWLFSDRNTSVDQLTTQFQALATQGNHDTAQADAGQAAVRPAIVELMTKIQQLAAGSHQATINRWLAKQPAGGLPESVASLQQQLQSNLNAIDHLTIINAQTIANLSSLHPHGSLTQLVVTGGQAISLTSNGSIYSTSLSTGASKLTHANTSNLGTIAATSAANGSVYILTKQPAVWRYQVANDSLTELTLPSGLIWPTATDLATYNGNLYLLTPSGIDKYVAITSSSFSAPTVALPASDPDIATATHLAIDGAIYGGSSDGLVRYLEGSLSNQGSLPSGLTTLTQLVAGNGNYIAAVDAKTGRLAIITATSPTLAATKEYRLQTGRLSLAAVDPATATAYVLNGTQLQKFTVTGF